MCKDKLSALGEKVSKVNPDLNLTERERAIVCVSLARLEESGRNPWEHEYIIQVDQNFDRSTYLRQTPEFLGLPKVGLEYVYIYIYIHMFGYISIYNNIFYPVASFFSQISGSARASSRMAVISSHAASA